MKLESAAHSNVREYVSSLAESGRYLFSSRDVQGQLGVSADAAKLALNRLARRCA